MIHYQFDEKLDEVFCERLVCVKESTSNFLSKTELTLKRAIKLSQVFKDAEKNVKYVGTNNVI